MPEAIKKGRYFMFVICFNVCDVEHVKMEQMKRQLCVHYYMTLEKYSPHPIMVKSWPEYSNLISQTRCIGF